MLFIMAAKKKTPIGPIKKGALHEALGVKQDKKVPAGKVEKIANAKIGTKVDGVEVTPLLKKRAVFAQNAKKWKH
jgi:hypothetical protein